MTDQTDDPMNDLLSALGDTKPTEKKDAASTTVYLDQLVGPGKQFKDAEAVAKAKVDADNFAKTLQRENKEMLDKMAELEKKAETKVALSDVLNELKNRTVNEPGNQPAISEDDIARKVRDVMDARDVEKSGAANVAASNAVLLKKFEGDTEAAKKFLASRVSALGLNGETVRNLAKTSPQAFAELLGLVKKDASGTTVNVRSTATVTNGNDSGERNQSFYSNLLKETGYTKFYQNKALLNQREQDMQRLGEAYYK